MREESAAAGVRRTEPGVRRRLLPTPAEAAFLLIAAAILAFQIVVPPVVGLADNGDFSRIMRPFGIDHSVSGFEDRYFGWLRTSYRFDPASRAAPSYFSSESLFVLLAVLFHLLLGGGESFDLRLLGVVHALALLPALYLLLYAARPLPGLARVVLMATLLLVFTDTAYVATLNSFYSEPASLLFILGAAGFALLGLQRREKLAIPLLGFLAASAGLVLSKPQNAILSPALALLALGIARRARSRRFLAGAVAGAIVLLASSAAYIRRTPPRMREAYLFDVVFYGMLPHSANPARDLAELGLPPEFARYSGMTGFTRGAPLRQPEFNRLFLSRVRYRKVALFYLRHPQRLAASLWRHAGYAFQTRPRNLGNFERRTGAPPLEQSRAFALWSSLKARAAPAGAHLALALLIAGVALLLVRRKREVRQGGRSELWQLGALLLAVALVQYALCVGGEGDYELIKHLFPFHVAFDLLIAGSLVLFAALLNTLLGHAAASGPVRIGQVRIATIAGATAAIAVLVGLALLKPSGSAVSIRLPIASADERDVSGVTRRGVWLYPGDSLAWTLPPGAAGSVRLAIQPAAGAAGGVIEAAAVGSGAIAKPGRLLGRQPIEPSERGSKTWREVQFSLTASREPIRLLLASRGGLGPVLISEPTLVRRVTRPRRIVILFLIDTLRADHVSAYGYRRQTTPRIDRFFSNGLLAERCLANAAWTLPSVASIFTSATVNRHGVGDQNELLPTSFPTLAETLSAHGIRTLAITNGGYVDSAFGFARGFERYVATADACEPEVKQALGMLDAHEGESVFLFFHTYQVHDYAPTEAAARALLGGLEPLGEGRDQPPDRIFRSTGEVSLDRQPKWLVNRYDSALRSVDDAFGSLVDGLAKRDLLGNTALLVTSDHGEELFERGGGAGWLPYWGHTLPYLYDQSIQVPLLVRVPWRPELSGKISRSVSLLDVAPTILDAFGLPAPSSYEGTPLAPTDVGAAEARPIYCDAPKYDSVAVMKGTHKLISRPDHSFASWLDGNPLPPAEIPLECFDLVADPEECHPLDCSNDWGKELQLALQKYIAATYPESVLFRIPKRLPGDAESGYLLRARSTDLRASSHGAETKEEPRVSRGLAESRLVAGNSPVWIAFRPLGSRSLDVEIETSSPVRSSAGRLLGDDAEASWTELLWRGEAALPDGLVVFSTPPGRAAVGNEEIQYTEELVARLRSLGYLTAGAKQQESKTDSPPPGQRHDRPGPAVSRPGTIRIRTVCR